MIIDARISHFDPETYWSFETRDNYTIESCALRKDENKCINPARVAVLWRGVSLRRKSLIIRHALRQRSNNW